MPLSESLETYIGLQEDILRELKEQTIDWNTYKNSTEYDIDAYENGKLQDDNYQI
jgi:hypothetical protein